MRSPILATRLVMVFLLCAASSTAVPQRGAASELIEDKVERLLRHRDVGELANELAHQTAQQTTESLLMKLSIFGRAGHRIRVLDTIKQIVRADDYKNSPYRSQVFHVAQKATANDLPAKRAFYELIALGGDEHINDFFWQWEKEGDINELEKWLEIRAPADEKWWNYWLELKVRLGKAQEVCDKLEDAIRQNPSDSDLVRKYLRAAASRIPTAVPSDRHSYVIDVSWLPEVVSTDSAFEAYYLAKVIRGQAPARAVKLLNKSLDLPFTIRDGELVMERGFEAPWIRPASTNREKQLRYWAKKLIADIYIETGQMQLAHPWLEELVAMDKSGIYHDGVYQTAGWVEKSIGKRTIEKKILNDEAPNADSPSYWVNRATYFRASEQKRPAWEAIMAALKKFPYKPLDRVSQANRIVAFGCLGDFADTEEREVEAEAIFRRELAAAVSANDGEYIFEFTQQTMPNAFHNLHNEFFIKTELLPFVLGSLKSWGSWEEHMLTNLMGREEWEPKKRERIWQELTMLARKDIRNRAFTLVKAMSDHEVANIPLLFECLKIAPGEPQAGINFTRADIEELLFQAYIDTGDWRKAEKMYADGFRGYSDLSRIARGAIEAGAVNEGLRVWQINANRDRRDTGYLESLSKTKARLLLQEFYRQMKRRDPLTDIPDKALALLN